LVQGADFRDHVVDVGNLERAERRQRGKVSFGDQIEARQEDLHRRSNDRALSAAARGIR